MQDIQPMATAAADASEAGAAHEHGADQAGPKGFILDAGEVCLDFANTLSTQSGEYVASYADLVRWAHATGVIDGEHASRLSVAAERDVNAADAVMGRARRLRKALKGLFGAVAADTDLDDADMAVLNRELATSLAKVRLAATDDGFVETWAGEADALDRLLWPVARSAASLLVDGGRLARVRECAARDCRWLFVDSTKNRSRQWCDMRVCGSREKARRYIERRSGRAVVASGRAYRPSAPRPVE